MSQIKPRLGQGRAGIKQNPFRFHVSPPLDKPEQQLLSGRRPIIQVTERPILQQPQNIIQPKATSKILVPQSLQLHDKFIPVPNYVIPQTRS